MAQTLHNARFFGLDLGVVWRELKSPWQDMGRWALSRWLTPAVPVVLLQANGSQSFWQADRNIHRTAGKPKPGAGFIAVELPDALTLRRRLTLPALSDSEIADAVALEVRGISPFAETDLAWGYAAQSGSRDRTLVDAVLASRSQVEQHLSTVNGWTEGKRPEVWALSGAGLPIVIAGFGEDRRAGQMARGRGMAVALLALAVIILVAIAATPTAQLQMRAVEAATAFTSVQQRAAKLTQQREALVQSTDRLKALSDLVADRTNPLELMDQLTRMLPDDTSVQSLKMQGHKISISGLTSDTAALMQQLGTQPGVKDVKAPSAAMRPSGSSKETFNIEFTLEAKQVPASEAAVQSQMPATQAGARPFQQAPPPVVAPSASTSSAATPATTVLGSVAAPPPTPKAPVSTAPESVFSVLGSPTVAAPPAQKSAP